MARRLSIRIYGCKALGVGQELIPDCEYMSDLAISFMYGCRDEIYILHIWIAGP